MNREPLPLFRAEALDSVRPKAYGRTIIVQPLSFGVLTTAAVLIAATIIGFFIWGRYTQHTTISGQLVPTSGIVSIVAPHVGVIVEKHVSEGDVVAADQILYLVSGEVYSESRGPVQAAAVEQLALQEQSLLRQIKLARLQQSQEMDDLLQAKKSLQVERTTIASMRETMQARFRLNEQALERQMTMADSGLVSKDQLASVQGQYLDMKGRLQSIDREDAEVVRRIMDVEAKQKALGPHYTSQISDMERSVSVARSGLTENEGRRLVAIRAPAAGIATAVVGEVGQVADPSRPLLAIVPDNEVLEAQLLAPTSTVGFIPPGSPVMLRYDAYPYQRFGHYEGRLLSVSRAPVAVSDSTPGTDGKASQPLYLVTVTLPSQSVLAYGEPHGLRAGMTVQADVMQDTRRLYEWALEPLYSVTGKLHAGSESTR